MSKYLVTFQEEQNHYEGLLGVHLYKQRTWNGIYKFKGDLPTEQEINEIRTYYTKRGYLDSKSYYTIVNMQKLAD